MAAIGALASYQSNVVTGQYGSLARPGAAQGAPLKSTTTGANATTATTTATTSGANPNAATQVSGAGDSLQVSSTASTRAEVQAATAQSQVAQAGVRTSQALDQSLSKTQDRLQQLYSLARQITDDPQMDASARSGIQKQMADVAKGLATLVQEENFLGRPTLNGSFDTTFRVGDTAFNVSAKLPTGGAFDAAGLGLSGIVSSAIAEGGSAGNASARGVVELHSQDQRNTASASQALTFVSSMRETLAETASALMQEVTGSSSMFGSVGIGPQAMGVAQKLASMAIMQMQNNGAAALVSQANVSSHSALQLLAS
ncbi:MAG: hypothetical protein Q4G30_08200 [Actinomycetaceae bacterium]|nr:hypothetical protein [Actinomycetaceae bacterium]